MAGDAEQAKAPIEDHIDESSSKVRTIRSAELLQGDREVCIDHEGEIYRLRLTRNQKLILQNLQK
jgi:hemin uptake protein HemP